MAITKVSRGLLNTGISDSSNATAITITSDENVLIGTTSGSDPLVVSDSGASSVTARLVNTNADANPANLRLQKLSGSPADGDYIGMINVSGENDASEETIFQSIDFISTDVSDGTEDGNIVFRTRGAGTLAERMKIVSDGQLHFNSGFGSAGKAYGVRAWATFDGNNASGSFTEGTNAGNMSSFTRTATGNFSLTMASAMPDTNYAVAAMASQSCLVRGPASMTDTTTVVKVDVTNGNGSAFANPDNITVLVVR